MLLDPMVPPVMALLCLTAAPPEPTQEPLRVFLRASGSAKASESCVARVRPVLRKQLGHERSISLLESEETAELVAVIDECATYVFNDSKSTVKTGVTIHGKPSVSIGDVEVEQEYGVALETRREFVVTVALSWPEHLIGVSSDSDAKSLNAAGDGVAKKVVQWVRENRRRVRGPKRPS